MMGYVTRFYGQITIEPPIPWGQIKDSPFLPSKGNDYRDLMFVIDEEQVDTDEGVFVKRHATGLECTWEGSVKAYDIVEHLQEVVSAFPGHRFVGRIDCAGEESGDMWQLCVRDGRAVRIEPRIVWPDDEAGA